MEALNGENTENMHVFCSHVNFKHECTKACMFPCKCFI